MSKGTGNSPPHRADEDHTSAPFFQEGQRGLHRLHRAEVVDLEEVAVVPRRRILDGRRHREARRIDEKIEISALRAYIEDGAAKFPLSRRIRRHGFDSFRREGRSREVIDASPPAAEF